MGERVRTDGPKTHLEKAGTPTMGGFVFILSVAIVTILFNRSRTQTVFPLFVATLAGIFGTIEDFTKIYKKSGLPDFFTHHFGRAFRKLGSVTANKIFYILFAPWYWFKEMARIVGSSDDKGIRTYHKFLIQGSIAGFSSYWVYYKLGWDYIWLPFMDNIHIGFYYPIFVFFLFLGVLNFVAFTDGLDGLAGGLSVISFLAYWVIASSLGYNSIAGFCATFVGALIPFLYFNTYPARIFMGNVGSHVLGAVLAILAVVMHREVALIFILLVFLLDGISSPLQQFSVKLTRKRLFRMAPIHHHFELLGWPETKVVFRFWLFGGFFALLGIFIALL